MTLDLFQEHIALRETPAAKLPAGVFLLEGFAALQAPALVAEVSGIVARAPYRHMLTPGGFRMSVAMTNCGDCGWLTDRKGYRYASHDPESGLPWPEMPKTFRELAQQAGASTGFPVFTPDSCLINRYEPGARMSLHQDRNERDFTQPIVSVSLGLPAVFLFGGDRRSDKPARIALSHGDVVVWGGAARLRFHGILPLKPGVHPLLGRERINLTFRKAG